MNNLWRNIEVELSVQMNKKLHTSNRTKTAKSVENFVNLYCMGNISHTHKFYKDVWTKKGKIILKYISRFRYLTKKFVNSIFSFCKMRRFHEFFWQKDFHCLTQRFHKIPWNHLFIIKNNRLITLWMAVIFFKKCVIFQFFR